MDIQVNNISFMLLARDTAFHALDIISNDPFRILQNTTTFRLFLFLPAVLRYKHVHYFLQQNSVIVENHEEKNNIP